MCSALYADVSPSVTRVNQSKTVEVRIMQLSLQSSLMILVSSRFQREHRERGAEWERGRKIRNFHPISRRISEMVQDMTKVTMID